ncbi:MAG: phosphoglycolate phosphatase [Candidatus Freyarchaeota archaeon]|nr:phosphoglycolate phosphatase [Candidatus Jordarchaeia archaeon]
MKFKVLVTDVDGTITGKDTSLYLPAVELIRRLARRVPVVLCSGNTACTLMTLSLYVGSKGPFVAENGGVVGSPFWQPPIKTLASKEAPLKALGVLKEKLGGKLQEADQMFRLTDVVLKRTVNVEEITSILGQEGVKVNVFDSGYAIHLCDPSVSKAVGVRVILDRLSLSSEDAVGIGDGANDVDLLEACGYGVALQNAPATLKKVADYVTKKPYGEGFVEAVTRLFKQLL